VKGNANGVRLTKEERRKKREKKEERKEKKEGADFLPFFILHFSFLFCKRT